MQKIELKPLSINEAYTSRRFATPKLKQYKKDVAKCLVKQKVPEQIHLILEFGLSNRGADLDNNIKIFQDCLQTKLGFNDNQIYRISAEKIIVPKGKEYISFKIEPYLM